MILSSAPLVAQAAASTEIPQKSTVCQLVADPKAYNHKLVEVTGLASHGFEDSGFSDPSCGGRYGGLWMEYGGQSLTGTMSTVSSYSRTRTKPAIVEGIAVPLVEDETFKRFDALLHEGRGNQVHATVIARFFAGKENFWGVKGHWGGYGHLGCCSLFLIQQVLSFDEHSRDDLDYSDESAHLDDAKCEQGLTRVDNEADLIAQQRDAESGVAGYAFSEPDRVAREELSRVAKITPASSIRLKRRSATPAAVFYDASVPGSKTRYALVVDKPYWLLFQAKDHSNVAWVLREAVQSCDPDKN